MTHLTHPWVGRMLVIGGVRTFENTNDGSRPERHAAIFMPEDHSEHVSLWREGGEYNTRKGNKPAQSLFVGRFLSSYPPATSAVVRSLDGGALNASQRGFDMASNATIPSALSLADLNTSIDHVEPRISSHRIAQALGFSDEADVRQLYDRNKAEIDAWGVSPQTEEKPSKGSRGGRPRKIIWFSEAQALNLSALSGAPNAPAVRRSLIEVYMAYRRGELPAQPEPTPRPLTLREKRLLVSECRKVNGVRAAQQMWKELDMPGGTQPDQTQLALAEHGLRSGVGIIVIGGQAVTYDSADYDLRDGDEAVVFDPLTKQASLRPLHRETGHDTDYDRRRGWVAWSSGTGRPYQEWLGVFILGRVISVRKLAA